MPSRALDYEIHLDGDGNATLQPKEPSTGHPTLWPQASGLVRELSVKPGFVRSAPAS